MRLFEKKDIIVITSVVLIAVLLLIPGFVKKDKLVAVITIEGKTVEEIDLNSIEQNYAVSPVKGTEIEICKGKIRFACADCKDKICVNTGWLDRNGQTAACLPQKIVISIHGSDSAPDMLTY